jgi:hypothetical protein
VVAPAPAPPVTVTFPRVYASVLVLVGERTSVLVEVDVGERTSVLVDVEVGERTSVRVGERSLLLPRVGDASFELPRDGATWPSPLL